MLQALTFVRSFGIRPIVLQSIFRHSRMSFKKNWMKFSSEKIVQLRSLFRWDADFFESFTFEVNDFVADEIVHLPCLKTGSILESARS